VTGVAARDPGARKARDLAHHGQEVQDEPEDALPAVVHAKITDDEALTDPVQRALSSFVDDLDGRELRVDYRWAGIFGLVLDFLPVVGEVPGLPRTWVAGGYSGHGNVLGFACGRLVARAILGDRDPLLDLFEPARLLG
jgi:glycine/D-amino acid oxidase-like deaminating enzyme